jgi:prepilin peptidase CpaA
MERMVHIVHIIAIVPLLAGVVILLAAALHDMAVRTVPNWMAIALAMAGLLVSISNETFALTLLAAVSVFLAAIFCWRCGWMGGGDVKLLGAVAILVPPHAVLTLLTFIAFSGGGLALVYLLGRLTVGKEGARLARPRPSSLVGRVVRAEAWRIRRGGPLPYACAISAGALITLFQTGV